MIWPARTPLPTACTSHTGPYTSPVLEIRLVTRFRHAYAMHSSCVRRTGTGPDGKSLFEIIEVLDFGVNLPPVQSVKNKYEQPLGTKPEIVTVNINLGNQPEDNSLPTKVPSIICC